MKVRGKFEVPPKGYRGSLKGTSWDVDEMNADYSPEFVAAGEMG